jgi:hypothetical protein
MKTTIKVANEKKAKPCPIFSDTSASVIDWDSVTDWDAEDEWVVGSTSLESTC